MIIRVPNKIITETESDYSLAVYIYLNLFNNKETKISFTNTKSIITFFNIQRRTETTNLIKNAFIELKDMGFIDYQGEVETIDMQLVEIKEVVNRYTPITTQEIKIIDMHTKSNVIMTLRLATALLSIKLMGECTNLPNNEYNPITTNREGIIYRTKVTDLKTVSKYVKLLENSNVLGVQRKTFKDGSSLGYKTYNVYQILSVESLNKVLKEVTSNSEVVNKFLHGSI